MIQFKIIMLKRIIYNFHKKNKELTSKFKNKFNTVQTFFLSLYKYKISFYLCMYVSVQCSIFFSPLIVLSYLSYKNIIHRKTENYYFLFMQNKSKRIINELIVTSFVVRIFAKEYSYILIFYFLADKEKNRFRD